MKANLKPGCPNCHALYPREDDKYCVYCGTKMQFVPDMNMNGCVYGPPIEADCKCTSCGYTWSYIGVGRYDPLFCPECGEKAAEVVKKIEPLREFLEEVRAESEDGSPWKTLKYKWDEDE